ncbi:MAG: FAD-binding oxidoreductase [Gammaproteobacteria bacterium]|nr:MAG: FAD-binding oxidoreductase [Gammaproteobacteria bacterium]
MELGRRHFLFRAALALSAATAALARWPAALARTVAAGLETLRGLVVSRSDPDYELWRRSMVWYLHKPARYPDLIVRPETEDDAVTAVRYAAEQGRRVITRATGHNPARGCLRNGGVLLDLSRLRRAEIDAEAGTAWVQPGLRSEDFVARLVPHGWSFPAAHTGIVGLGGYLIGGGLGWNMPAWDIACRSIIAADIVLADGRRVTATANDHPDLLWAVRGAGPGFFGAVLRYKLRLFRAPGAIVKSKFLVPVAKLDALLEALQAVSGSPRRRRELEILAVLGRFGPADVPRARRELVAAVSFVAFGRDRDDAMAMLQPVRDSRIPALAKLSHEDAELSYAQLYTGNETDYTSPYRTAIHNIWTNDIGAAFRALAERWQEQPPRSPKSFMLSAWGVDPSPDDADSSFTYTGDHYLSWYLMADEEADVPANDAWMDAAVERLQPWTAGHYPNEIDPGRYPAALRECFSAQKWQRLAELRRRYDPDGLFFPWLGYA